MVRSVTLRHRGTDSLQRPDCIHMSGVGRKTCADHRTHLRPRGLNREKERYSSVFITKRRLASLASASALIATVAVASMPMAALAAKPTGTPSAHAASTYRNGFEKAADAVMPDDDSPALSRYST